MSDLLVRPAQLTDLIELRALYAAMMAERPQIYPIIDDAAVLAFTTDVARHLSLQDPGFLCHLATYTPPAVGFVLGALCQRTVGAPHLFAIVHYLYVAPGARGQGVGRQLSAAMLGDLQARGAQAVEISTLPGDDQWERRGWIPISTTYTLPTHAIAATFTPTREANGDARDE